MDKELALFTPYIDLALHYIKDQCTHFRDQFSKSRLFLRTAVVKFAGTMRGQRPVCTLAAASTAKPSPNPISDNNI